LSPKRENGFVGRGKCRRTIFGLAGNGDVLPVHPVSQSRQGLVTHRHEYTILLSVDAMDIS